MDLYLIVFSDSPQRFRQEMLLNPFEERFNMLVVAVKRGNAPGWEAEVVGVEEKRLSRVRCEVDNPSEVGWVMNSVPFARQTDSMVAQDVALPVDRLVSVADLK